MAVRIFTERAYETWASWHVIYEWEDVFAKNGIPLLYNSWNFPRRLYRFIERKLGVHPYFRWNPEKVNVQICFLMAPPHARKFFTENTIPIYVDVSLNELPEIIRQTKNLPIYFVTSYCAYEILREKFHDKKCVYLPFSVSDRYVKQTKSPHRDIDILQLGRKNRKLHEWALEYAKKHADVDYVYQTQDASLTYESTIHGNIGRLDTRETFMSMLSRARISLVSSPAFDGGRNFGEGFDFFTPRFFESAAMGCYMLGRYSMNKEAGKLNIASVCPFVENQAKFVSLVDERLQATSFLQEGAYKKFLEENRTSKRVEELKRYLFERKIEV